MAIINCKECGGKVSEDAGSCPHCGSVNFSKNKENKNTFIALLNFAGATAILFILYKAGWFEWFKNLF